jgi:predicted membrane protein
LEVFANAQIGNIVLMSSYIFQGKLYNAVRCSIPVLAFITGIYLAQVIHRHFKYMKRIHWRQLIIAAEISLLLTVGFIPNSLDILANSLV